MFDEAVKTTLV